MKKTLILAAFAAVTAATVAAAQTPPAGPPPGGRGRGPGGPGGPMIEHAALQGITLSAAQETQLQALHDAGRQQMQANMEADRSVRDSIRAARQAGDSARVATLMAAERAKMDARQLEQLTALRAILTGDQVATFDANVAEIRKRQAQGPPAGMRGRGVRGGPPPAFTER